MASVLFSCCPFLFLFLVGGCVGALFSPAQERQIEDFVQAAMACSSTPGLTVAVVKGNQSWTRGFGQADIERGVNVTSSTLFAVGSNSKAFTVALLASLLNGSRFTWDSRLREILGEDFELYNDELSEQTTLRDILSHRTGLERADIAILAGYWSNVSRSVIARRLKELKPKFPFRDRFLYNNWMYVLVGHVIEVLSGQSWGEALQSRLLEPLRMRASRVVGQTVQINDEVMAKPYFLHKGRLQAPDPRPYKLSPFEPSGGVASTADDMVHWLNFLLREGRTEDGRPLVEKKLLRECFRVAQPLQAGDPGFSEWWPPRFPITHVTLGYGYAWFKDDYRGRKAIWHGGGLYTYISYMFLFPDQDFAVFVGESGPMKGLTSNVVALFLIDTLLGESPFLNHTTACTYPAPWQKHSSVIDDAGSDVFDDVVNGSLSPYLGTYGNRFFGDVQIVENAAGNGLYLQYGLFEGPLNRTNDSSAFHLYVTGALYFLSIRRDNDQVVPWPVNFQSFQSDRFHDLELHDPTLSISCIYKRDVRPAAASAAHRMWNRLGNVYFGAMVTVIFRMLS